MMLRHMFQDLTSHRKRVGTIKPAFAKATVGGGGAYWNRTSDLLPVKQAL